jgi:hypothetical protein
MCLIIARLDRDLQTVSSTDSFRIFAIKLDILVPGAIRQG